MWRNSVNFASCYIKHTSSFSGTKVRRLDMLNKHIKCGVITHSAKETGWQKKQWEGRLRWQESVCEGEEGRKNLKKREGGNIGFFSWNRRVSTPLPTMLKKLPPIIKLRPPPHPHSWLNPISSKNFPSPPPPPHSNHFWKSHPPPPLYEGGRFGLCIIFKIKKTHCVK